MVDKSFSQYFFEFKEDYNYKLKLACDYVDDSVLDKLEEALERFELKSASAFKQTPIQEHPLDFPNVRNSAVFISEITLGYPASTDLLRRFIADAIGYSEQVVMLYSEQDPRDQYVADILERMSPEWKEQYIAKTGTEVSEDEACDTPVYGDELVSEFMQKHDEIKAEREMNYVHNELSVEQVTDDVSVSGPQDPAEGGFSLFGRPKGK